MKQKGREEVFSRASSRTVFTVMYIVHRYRYGKEKQAETQIVTPIYNDMGWPKANDDGRNKPGLRTFANRA